MELYNRLIIITKDKGGDIAEVVIMKGDREPVEKYGLNALHTSYIYSGDFTYTVKEILVEDELGWRFKPPSEAVNDSYDPDQEKLLKIIHDTLMIDGQKETFMRYMIKPIEIIDNIEIVNGKKEIFNEEGDVIEIIYFEDGVEVGRTIPNHTK